MNKISSIQSIDEWEKFYIEQSLKCYNADAFEAALIMLGLAGEYLATKLIEKMEDVYKRQDDVFAKHMSKKSGNYILFCSSKEHMDEMKDQVGEWFHKVDQNPHIYTAFYLSLIHI